MDKYYSQFFMLDPNVVFLNHGSFGACPKPVFKVYQDWQRKLEQQPVKFLGRDLQAYDYHARQELGSYLHADPNDLVYVTNATFAVNIVARSMKLSPGDEVLASSHEYGACDNAWEFVCNQTGGNYIRQPIPLPVCSEEEIVAQFWRGVTSKTRIIFLSHITSPTALRLPVEEICRKARQFGILTLIDGAHAPGQIPLDLPSIGADYYVGNCHKWMLAPKGAGFLFARKEVQDLIDPLVVSWGFHATEMTTSGSKFLDFLQWSGTKDPSAALAVPSAIHFMQEHNWEQGCETANRLLSQAIQRISTLVELPASYPVDSGFYRQVGIAPLPEKTNLIVLKSRLYDEFQVEAPLTQLEDQKFIRISVQAYNNQDDIDKLLTALEILLPQVQELK